MRKINLLVLLLAVLAIAGCGRSESTGYASPEEAYAAMHNAVEAKDWEKFARCLTPESREGMAGAMMMMSAFMAMDENIRPDLEEIFKEHGLDKAEDSQAKEPPKTEVEITSEGPSEEDLKEMAKPIKDKIAYIAQMMALLDKASKGQAPGPPKGKLAELKIDGDTATAVVVTTKDGAEQKEPFEFKRIDGHWFVQMPKSSFSM